MNNEPVAWMFQGAFDISTYVSVDKPNPDIYPNPTPLYTYPVKELTDEVGQQQAEIEALKQRIEYMREKASLWEAMAHAGGFEAGRQQGMKQERALWQLAASTQEIENEQHK